MTVVTPYDRHIRKILTASEWASADPTLPIGVTGIESDTGLAKLGNGSSAWSDLPYSTYPGPGHEPFTTEEKEKLQAYPSVLTDKFTLQASCYTIDPADSTTYYFGGIPSSPPTTTAGSHRIYNPQEGGNSWIRSIKGFMTTGTAGTSESGALYIVVYDASDTLVSTTLIKSDLNNSSSPQTISKSGLDIAFAGGHWMALKWVTPAWATNPLAVRFGLTVWCDNLGTSAGLDVDTMPATGVGDTSATLNGLLVDLGSASSVNVSFEYGKTTAYGSTTTPEALTAPGAFDAVISSLDASTLYHFRAKAVGDTTVYGEDLTFTTGTGSNPSTLYGTGYYTGTDPIGGGAGYSEIWPASGTYDYRVDTKTELLAALSSATSGQKIYIESWAEIDMSGIVHEQNFDIGIGSAGNIILCSNRGEGGAAGGLIYTNTTSIASAEPHKSEYRPFFEILGDHVRFSGIRLRGPQSGPSGTSRMTGIKNSGYHGLRVDNCEVYNWPFAGIANYADGAAGSGGANFSTVDWDKAAQIKCCYIHNCQQSGFGYGFTQWAGSGYVLCCWFNSCRHFVSGERDGGWSPQCDTQGSWSPSPTNGKEVYCKCHYIVFGYGASPQCTGTQFDEHGGSDTCLDGWGPFPNYQGKDTCWAGGEIEIKWCDFCVPAQGVFSIRGIARYSWTFTYNWVKQGNGGLTPPSNFYSICKQRLFTIPGYSDAPPYVVTTGEEILVANNWWHATEPPPES